MNIKPAHQLPSLSFDHPMIYLWLIVLLSCIFNSHQWVYAQDTQYEDARGDATINQATLDQAENLFFEALSLYSKKKYQEATQYFEKAYKLVAHRDLLFNIARSYEQMKKKKDAIKWYKKYLATKPIDETTIIHRLKLLGDEPNIKKTQTTNQLAPKKPDSQKKVSFKEMAPWLSMGIGVVLVGIGSWSGINALDSAEQARNAKIKKTYNTFKSNAESEALTADLTISIGAIAIGLGAYLWYDQFKNSKRSTTTRTQVSLDIKPDAAHIGYVWEF